MDDNIWGFLENKLSKMPEKVEKPKKEGKKTVVEVKKNRA